MGYLQNGPERLKLDEVTVTGSHLDIRMPGYENRLIADAKGESMPNDTIARAVKRGTGEIEGASYEEVLYEGSGPGGTLFLVEGMTDNRNRTVAEIRKIFEKNNGALGGGGAAGWAFERKGVIRVAKPAATEDQLMDIAVGAGADDYSAGDDEWQITTAPEVMNAVGAGVSCYASYLIGFAPFVVLEAVWCAAALAAMLRGRAQ